MVDYDNTNLVNASNKEDIVFKVDIPYKKYYWDVSYKLQSEKTN